MHLNIITKMALLIVEAGDGDELPRVIQILNYTKNAHRETILCD